MLPKPKRVTASSKTVKLAHTLINAWYDEDFDFTSYDDHYRERVKRLIEAKKKGHEVTAPDEGEEPEVIDLMKH